ncbi:hypothetical protein [Methanocella conradii]|uniref:hypothetical protein n=1 Tax=Methanocella conradii TaxID=1175444 RepID=UPI00157DEE49|nr:hypothetical protein [Methanocella conradii]
MSLRKLGGKDIQPPTTTSTPNNLSPNKYIKLPNKPKIATVKIRKTKRRVEQKIVWIEDSKEKEIDTTKQNWDTIARLGDIAIRKSRRDGSIVFFWGGDTLYKYDEDDCNKILRLALEVLRIKGKKSAVFRYQNGKWRIITQEQ